MKKILFLILFLGLAIKAQGQTTFVQDGVTFTFGTTIISGVQVPFIASAGNTNTNGSVTVIFSAGQTVSIGSNGVIALAAGQTISIGSTGTVALAAGQTISIGSTGTVGLSAGTTVDIGGSRNVTFSASGTNSATVTFGDFTLPSNCRGIGVVLDVTTVTGSGIFTLEIDNKDTLSGKYVNVGTSANVSTVSTNTYRAYPGLTAVANVDFNAFVSTTYRIRLTKISGTSQAFSVGGWTIP